MRPRTVFISGGTSGINLGIAKAFATSGDSVMVFGRDPEKAKAAAAEIGSGAAGKVLGASADVRDYAAVADLFARSAAQLGPADVIIAGAAGNFMAPALSISANGFKTVVDIDLMGSFNVFRAGFDVARKPGASMIAITAPQAAQPMAQQVHVCAAKAGVNMVVKVLAMEWGPAGIRVNAISPGPIAGTEGVERMAPTAEEKAAWIQHTALRRLGTREDIAAAALFLASDAADYVTGTIFDCDGGMSLGDASGDYVVVHNRGKE